MYNNMESRWDYPSKHLQGLNNMRRQDQLCDVTIQVEGRKFHAHKAVLAATGDYFLTMFTSGFRESSAQEITIEGSAAAFEILLNFVYTGEVDRRKVAPCMYEVLEMACYMQFTEFREICSSAIKKLLKTTDQFSTWDVCQVMLFAQTQKYLRSLYKATLKHLEDKVESLKSLDIFLENVSATFLQDFLDRENLATASEGDHVLELVINWLKHDWEKRKGHSHQLLKKVRLGLVSPEDIKKLIGPEVLEIPGCSELVSRVVDLQASQKSKDILAVENPDIAASRSYIMAPVVKAIRGKLQYYDVEHEKWFSMEKMDPLPVKTDNGTENGKYDLIVVNGILYAAGGSSGKEFLIYHSLENKWLPLPSKPLGKILIRLVAHGAYIYAFGACCEPEVFMIERYDINVKKWEVLKKAQESKPDKDTSKFSLVIDTTTPISHCYRHSFSKADLQIYHNFAVVFKDKIFIISLEQKAVVSERRFSFWGQHPDHEDVHCLVEKLTIFDPEENTCQVSDLKPYRRDDDEWWEETCFKPTLFIYQDQLYRMICGLSSDDCQVFVTKVSLTQVSHKVRVTLGRDKLRSYPQQFQVDDEHQDAPFYIQDKIFVTPPYSMVKQTGSASNKRHMESAEHDKVNSFPQYGENKQLICIYDASKCLYPVWFSFEKKQLTKEEEEEEEESDDYSTDDDDSNDDDNEEEEDSDEEEDF